MIKKFLIFILFLLIANFSFADSDIITKFDEDNVVSLNENLRKLDIDEQIKENDGLDLQSRKITDLATPTATTDAVNKAYVDTQVATKAAASHTHAGTDITSAVSYNTRMKTGTYTGNGAATKAITGVGFQPKYVVIYKNASAGPQAFKSDQDTTYAYENSDSATYYVADAVISLDADGFTVGDGSAGGITMNAAAVYTYICFG